MHTILFPVNELKIGGAEQQLLELVRGLDKQRFHPIVASLYPGGSLDAEFRAIEGAEVVDLHRRGKYDISPLFKVAALLRSRQIDIIQPFLTPATFFGLLPALLVGTPVRVVTERCGVRRVRRLGYWLYSGMEDLLTAGADIVVANSQAGCDIVLQRGIPIEKVLVVYNGINRARLTPDPAEVRRHLARLNVPPDGCVIGMLASLTPPKGHADFLRALALLVPAQPGLRGAIVGDGPLRAELEALAVSLGLGDRVVFFGSQRAVADYLAACDLVVSASGDNEGCSNSILEAMALGIPVVATDVGGNRELVVPGETGYLTPSGDAATMAATLATALDQPEATRAVAARAQRLVDTRFSLERMVADYEQLYDRLLARRDQRVMEAQGEPQGEPQGSLSR